MQEVMPFIDYYIKFSAEELIENTSQSERKKWFIQEWKKQMITFKNSLIITDNLKSDEDS